MNKIVWFHARACPGTLRAPVRRTLASASELRRGLEAERVMPGPISAALLGSWLESVSPAEPRVTELPAFLRDVLQEPGASVVGGLLKSCCAASKTRR